MKKMPILRKFLQFLKYIKFWKDGGVAHLVITQINYPAILKGKRIIITGGSSGIGLAMAKKFLSLGADVLITGRNQERLESVCSQENNSHMHFLQWDVSDLEVMDEMFDKAVLELGGCDMVVNNAAYVAHKQTDLGFYNKMMNTNLRSVFFMCKKAVAFFEKENGLKGGKILNISSVSAQKASISPYSVSKAGVNAITRGFAKEYASKNIIVNGIAPGYCASSINYMDISENAYCEKSANKRIITPEEIAELAAFLLSDAANGIIGQTLLCDGGAML